MLSPDEIQAVINDISQIYERVESTCIQSIAKRLGEGKKIKSVDVWRVEHLSNANALRKQLVQEVSKQSRIAYEEVKKEIETALTRSNRNDSKTLQALDTVGEPEQMQMSQAFQNVLKATLKKCVDHLNYTGTQAVEASITQYKQAINTAYLEVLSGSSSIYDSTAKACKELGGGGIKLHYKNNYTTSLDSAIKRDIVTTINQAGAELTLEDCNMCECDLVETSWHMGARPEHEVWQGKVFSLSGKSKKYPPFYSSTRYGEVDGLCGINCRHSFQPYDEEVGQATQKNKPTAKENREIYEKQQKQRYYERTIRKYKHEQQAMLAGEFTEEAKLYQSQINTISKQYRQYLQDNNLRRYTLNERVTVYHAISSKNSIAKPNLQEYSEHKEKRQSDRGISDEDIRDTIEHPLRTKEVRADGTYQIIGEKCTIAVNAKTGKIVSTWKTHSKLVKKLKDEDKK